jgi:hypothetical protein
VNPLERAVRAVDKYQQRHTPLAFVVAVVRKFGDDRGGTLATSLTYSAFVAVFPLLLLFVTILGFVLGSNQDAEDAVLRSALVEFPILGDQLVSSLATWFGGSLMGAVGQNPAAKQAAREIGGLCALDGPGQQHSGALPEAPGTATRRSHP